MAEWTTESLRAALDSGGLGFWEEDNHGASSPDRRYGAWIETDDLPSPEEFDALLAAHDAEIKAEALEEAVGASMEWISFKPDGWGSNPADQSAITAMSWVLDWLRDRAAAIRGEQC